ncbi:hypothetical protein, partial [Pantoea sp.]|uniref:hypothetical protein n=1 Tax=Pantoea sp. TaxID=69393 RepID=UPI0031CF4CB0
SFRSLSGIHAASSWPSRSIRRSGWRPQTSPVGAFSFFLCGVVCVAVSRPERQRLAEKDRRQKTKGILLKQCGLVVT